MKKGAFLILVSVYLLAPSSFFVQDLRLPRDPEKLIDRAHKFWAALTSGQRSQALEFILPEKKDLFLSGTPIPILKAKVLGLDFTGDLNRAAVRVSLDVLDAATGSVNWTIADPWVWRGGNWYLNLESPPGIFPTATGALDIKETQRKIEQGFEILRNPVELGMLNEGQYLRIEVPIKYAGDVPVSVELGLPNPLVDVESPNTITSKSKHLVLLVGTENWEGPFNLPLPLKIKYQGATVERTLQVRGEVFVPLAFRQEPPNGPIEAGREFSVFIRNNTTEQAKIRFISTDAKLNVVKQPELLLPDQESEIVFKLRPGESPDRMYLQLDAALYGRDTYTYRFRNVRR